MLADSEMLKSGMLEGWRETVDRLAVLPEKGALAEPPPAAAEAEIRRMQDRTFGRESNRKRLPGTNCLSDMLPKYRV